MNSPVVEPLRRPQMSNVNVLVDIFSALQRLETSLEDQHHRLSTIEVSIHSGISSPISDGFSPMNVSLAKAKELLDLPRPSSPPSSHAGYAASDYEASVMKLSKRQFNFTDDSCSDLQYDEGDDIAQENDEGIREAVLAIQSHAESLDIPGPSTHWNRGGKHTPHLENCDAYTQSVYSSRPLSRLELEIPPVPPLPEDAYQVPTTTSFFETYTVPVEAPKASNSRSNSVRTHVKALSASLSPVWSIQRRRSWSSRRSKSRSSLSSTESTGRRSHEQVEMAFYAYDNFKGSIQSSMSLTSKERRASHAEARRLRSLGPVSRNGVTIRSEKKGSEGKGGLDILYSFFVRAFGTASSKFHPERVSIVA